LVADTDKDGTGTGYIQRAKTYLCDGEPLSQRTKQWTADIEEEFWDNGFDGFIDSLVAGSQRSRIASEAGGDLQKEKRLKIKSAEHWGKPALAEKLVAEIQRRGSPSIPASVKSVIDRVVELAKG